MSSWPVAGPAAESTGEQPRAPLPAGLTGTLLEEPGSARSQLDDLSLSEDAGDWEEASSVLALTEAGGSATCVNKTLVGILGRSEPGKTWGYTETDGTALAPQLGAVHRKASQRPPLGDTHTTCRPDAGTAARPSVPQPGQVRRTCWAKASSHGIQTWRQCAGDKQGQHAGLGCKSSTQQPRCGGRPGAPPGWGFLSHRHGNMRHSHPGNLQDGATAEKPQMRRGGVSDACGYAASPTQLQLWLGQSCQDEEGHPRLPFPNRPWALAQ